jgi:integrase
MPIVLKDYIKTKHTGIQVHQSDKSKFLLVCNINNKRFRRLFTAHSALGMKDRLKTAYDEREAFMSTLQLQSNSGANMGATVDDYFEIHKKSKKWSKEVKRGYENYYKKHIQPLLGSKKVVDVQPFHISQVMDSLIHYANRTRKMALEILKPLFKRAMSDRLIQLSPVTEEHNVTRNQKAEKRLVPDAVKKYKAVHKAIMQVYEGNAHHRALFLFGFSGRRKTETLQIRWEDIDFNNRTYIILGENSKTGADMTFVLSEELYDALSEFRDVNGKVFNISWISDAVKKIRIASGVEQFTFHYMRNLCVSALSTQGVEAITLSGLLGHTSTATVKQYLDLQREEASAKALDVSKRILG